MSLAATRRKPSSRAWQDWIYFGAAVMALMGMSWALLGLVAVADGQYFPVRADGLLALSSYLTWGWVHLVGGLLAVGVGAGLLWGGHPWARLAGIVVAGLSAVVNLGFLAASPGWSTLLIALDVLVIYALTVHGREIEES